MTTVVVTETIRAPIEIVFQMLTDPRRSADIDPDVLGVEFVSLHEAAPGARFRQTRRGRRGETVSFEFEIVEYEPASRARIVNDTHGTRWDTLYSFASDGDATRVTLTMDAHPGSLAQRLVIALTQGMIRRSIAKHLSSARSAIEAHSSAKALR
ncbi:MAG: SRPBCC family protein [Myxococcota bacterium]